jgi:hypothetical protein
LYSLVVPITDGVGAIEQYKFVFSGPGAPGGGTAWENPGPGTPTTGGNRYFIMPNATATVLPKVYFSDQLPNDFLIEPTDVTFTVNMTGAVGTDSQVFDPASSSVFINGDFLGWRGWDSGSLADYQLTNNPVGSSNYSLTISFPAGTPLALTYKYSINGQDNEAASGQNHLRLVRTLGAYTMPTDKFGTQFAEASFGQLKVGQRSGATVPISWVGRPGVHLQSSSNLTTWNDLPNTDGAHWTTGSLSNDGFVSVTNYPAATSPKFFRLVKPGN